MWKINYEYNKQPKKNMYNIKNKIFIKNEKKSAVAVFKYQEKN